MAVFFCLLVSNTRYNFDFKSIRSLNFLSNSIKFNTKSQILWNSSILKQKERLFYNIFGCILCSGSFFYMFVIKKMLYLHLVKKIKIINVLF